MKLTALQTAKPGHAPIDPHVTNGYKRTEAGVIPEDWEVKQISSLKPFITSGSRGWAAFYSDRGSPFIRITNLCRKSIFLDLEDLRFVKVGSNNAEVARTRLEDGDVLISITADIGIVGYVSARMPKPAYINQHIALLRFDPETTNPKFVSYFLASEKPQKLFRALTDSGAKAGMNLTTVQQIHLALPPTKTEQESIAGALSDADALIESMEQLITKKRQIKQVAMQELLAGKKRLPGFRGEWDMKRMGEIISVLADYTANGSFESLRNNVRYYESRNYAVLVRTTDLDKPSFYPERFTDKRGYEFLSKSALFGGEIIIANVGSIGKVFRVPFFEMPMTLAPNTYLLKFNASISENFICQKMMTQEFYSKLISKIGSTTLQAINKDNLRDIELSIPREIEEQTAIAAVLSDMDGEIAALGGKHAKAQQIKQGMMQELLTGKVRLK